MSVPPRFRSTDSGERDFRSVLGPTGNKLQRKPPGMKLENKKKTTTIESKDEKTKKKPDPPPSPTTTLKQCSSLCSSLLRKNSASMTASYSSDASSSCESSHLSVASSSRKMKAEKQGYFTQEEWTRGLVALGVVTLDKLKKALPELEKEVRKQSNFADFYAYAFTYSLTEEKQESIDIETISQLLDTVMGSTFRPQVDYFVDYLKIQNDYKVINMDQWMGFYRFCNEISFPDMSEYKPELAWPLVLDNFVEWIREKTNLKA